MLTHSKIVIVGLKPTPKTWLRAPRELEEGGGKTKWKGTLSWFPSVSTSQGSPKKAANGKDEATPATTPILVYTWGNSLRLLKVTEVRGRETVRNPRTGKTTEMEVGRMAFEDAGRWAAPSDILASQWLNANVGSFASCWQAWRGGLRVFCSSFAASDCVDGRYARSVRFAARRAG